MTRRGLVLLSIIAVTSIGLYAKTNRPDLFFQKVVFLRANTAIATKVIPVGIDKAIPSVLDDSSKDMRRALEDAYRLRPDKRFLLAVGEVYHFLTGERKSEAVARYDDGLWKIRYGDYEVGSLKENPDFSDFIKLLSGWVEQLNALKPLRLLPSDLLPPETQTIIDRLEIFLSPDSTNAMREIDRLWAKGERRPVFLYSSMRALVFLSTNGLDEMGLADQLPAKALAHLVLAKVLTSYDTVREECLLADAMRYSGHAEKLAKSLLPNDAIRAYVLQDDSQLESLAKLKDSPMETRFFWLERLSAHRDFEAWFRWLDSAFGDMKVSLPILKTGFDMSLFQVNRNISLSIRQTILYQLLRENSDIASSAVLQVKNFLSNQGFHKEFYGILNLEDPDLGELTGIFESKLEAVGSDYPGPFLDRDTYKAYYQGFFYSSLYKEGLHYLDAQSRLDMAQTFLKSLDKENLGVKIKQLNSNANHDSPATSFVRWYGDLVASKAGKGNIQHLMADLASLTDFGSKPLLRTLKSAKLYFKFGDPALSTAVKRIVFLMDNRPVHSYELANLAFNELYDLHLAEKSYRYVAESDPLRSSETNVFYYDFFGNKEQVMSFLQKSGVDVKTKLYALKLIKKSNLVSDLFLRERYEQLVSENPDLWTVNDQYAEYLKEMREYEHARTILQKWLDRDVVTGGLETTVALNMIAETYYLQKRYGEGWEVISKIVSGMHGGTLRVAGRLLDKLGDKNNAETIFRENYSRYPDSLKSFIPLITFLWEQGRYKDAADTLFSYGYPITPANWKHEIAKPFALIFAKRAQEEGMAAFSFLLAHRPDPFVAMSPLSRAVQRAGNSKLAFEMQSSLRGQGISQISLDLDAYKYLKAWKGEEAALNWLKQKIPVSLHSPASMLIFASDEQNLLWSLIKSPDEYGWLMRAAVSLKKSSNLSQRDRQSLTLYYKIAKDGFYNAIGLYLLGLLEQDNLLDLANNPKERCEVAYFIGYKAQQEGRYEDASDWYRIVVETGLPQYGEYRWALNALYDWRLKGISLSRLALIDGDQS